MTLQSAHRPMSDLAERLKRETHALHRAAERSGFMATLLRGRMDRPSYCALLRNLHAICAALEPAQAFRSGLDALVVGAAAADAIVGEAVLAFELHCSLFDELARERGVAGDPRSALADT